MNLENQGQSVALIVDENKKNSNVLLSVEPKKQNVYNYLKELKLKEGQHFQLIPNISVARDICYVTGASALSIAIFVPVPAATPAIGFPVAAPTPNPTVPAVKSCAYSFPESFFAVFAMDFPTFPI